MIAKNSVIKVITLVSILLLSSHMIAQNDTIPSLDKLKYIDFYDYRGTNVIDAAIGTSVMNGDFENPLFEIYFKGGYKRYLAPHFALTFSYHKFNLAYEDVFNFGFMSFDLNQEYLVFPHKKFSPFLFAGVGLNASNYFEETAPKVQIGGGVEYIVRDGIGISLFSDYNHVFDDTLDGLEFGDANDTYFRIGFGVSYYFGGSAQKAKLIGNKTVINSNLIMPKKERITK